MRGEGKRERDKINDIKYNLHKMKSSQLLKRITVTGQTHVPGWDQSISSHHTQK